MIDSNAIIDFCNGKLSENERDLLLSITPTISIVTNIELFATKNITQEEFDLSEKFISLSTVHPVDNNLVQTVVNIRQNYKIKFPDAIIAATALVYDLILISRNTKDLDGITGLSVINPHLL